MGILIVACLVAIGLYHIAYNSTKKEKEFYKRKCVLAYKKIYTSMDTVKIENFLSEKFINEKVSNR